jgi:paraquat-inducible protein B
LGSDDTQALPSSVQSALLELNGILDSVSPDSTTAKQLNNSLQELTQVLRNLESVTRTLSDQPSTLIFSQPIPEDPVPTKRSSP